MEYESLHEPALQAPDLSGEPAPINNNGAAATEGAASAPRPSSVPDSGSISDLNPAAACVGSRVVTLPSGMRVLYPPSSLPNPFALEPGEHVHPILGKLERPKYVPADLDERLSRENVWMKVVPTTGEVVFFLPQSCAACTVRQIHCDRALPACQLCARTNVECQSGEMRVLVSKADEPQASAVDTANGNGKTHHKSWTGTGKSEVPNSSESDGQEGQEPPEMEERGRGKRIKKKRRLSDDMVDPTMLNFDGTALKKSRPRAPRTSILPVPAHIGPARPENVHATEEDKRYQAAVRVNNDRPDLLNMRGCCPVWADRRRALFAAAEYFRAPVHIPGASVEIGPSGIARGVVLEGTPPVGARKPFWGEAEQAGTIVTYIGAERRRVFATSTGGPFPCVPRPATNEGAVITDDYNRVLTRSADAPQDLAGLSNGSAPARGPPTTPLTDDPEEPPPVEALLMAQRARTPVAVAVSQDYSEVPFKVPRAVIVLGWFWIVDAWTEPVLPKSSDKQPGMVIWKFRFEWCDGSQSPPWWTMKGEPERVPIPAIEPTTSAAAWPIRGKGVTGSTTLRGATEGRSTKEREEDDNDEYRASSASARCPHCERHSDRVYESASLCLNERCSHYFREIDGSPEGDAEDLSVDPTFARQEPRIMPQSLHLSLLPPNPTKTFSDIRRHDAHRDFWRAWVCQRCRYANERRDWAGFLCEACSFFSPANRKILSEDALRPPTRPVSTGPRPDYGAPNWPFPVATKASTFEDGIKVLQHGLEGAFGVGSVLYHALNSEGVAPNVARAVLTGLQMQGEDEVRFRRNMLPAFSSRSSELALSPFYTFLCGPEEAPYIAHFPAEKAVPWTEAPKQCRDAMSFINERAGRMVPGKPEFNSLLTAAMPPVSPATVHPTVPIGKESLVAFTILGPDGVIKLRRASGPRTRAGEISVQHGDVVLLCTGPEAVDVELKTDGFGFVCIARQLASGATPHAQAAEDTLRNLYVGPYPVDPTNPLRGENPVRDPPVLEPRDEEATGDQAPVSDRECIFAEQAYRGQMAEAPRAEPTELPLPSFPPIPSLGGDTKPKRGRAASSALAPRGGGGGRGRGKSSTPTVAGSTGTRGGSTRGRGRGRGRGSRGRGGGRRGGHTSSARQSSAGASGTMSVDREGEGDDGVDVKMENVDSSGAAGDISMESAA